VPMHPLCLALMPDFQPTSEVICSSPFHIYFQSYSSLLIMILSFSTGYRTCPSCLDNLLQYYRPNFCPGVSISYSGPTDV
jgi:hypothetical protein